LGGLLGQKTSQLFVGPRRDPPDGVPFLNQLAEQQETFDLGRTVLAPPVGAFRHNGLITPFPRSQRVQAKASNFGYGPNRVTRLHP